MFCLWGLLLRVFSEEAETSLIHLALHVTPCAALCLLVPHWEGSPAVTQAGDDDCPR